MLFLCVEKEPKLPGRLYANKFLEMIGLEPFNIIILYDSKINPADNSLLLWKMFNNVDPERDLFIHKNRLVIDACKKYKGDGHPREWPDELLFEWFACFK